MIRSFKGKRARDVFERRPRRDLAADVQRAAYRKLLMLDAAAVLDDLRSTPGNRLEKLAGNRSGQYSIRVNSQWRICFVWRHGHPHAVELVDYH